MSWIVPRMLEAWVQATRRVLGERRGVSDDGVSLGLLSLLVEEGCHHLMVRF